MANKKASESRGPRAAMPRPLTLSGNASRRRAQIAAGGYTS